MGVAEDRADLRGSIIAGNAALNPMFDELARLVRQAIVRHSEQTPNGQRIPARARPAIMRDVNAALDRYFPRYRGGPSLLEQAIVERSARAADKPVARAVTQIAHDAPEIATTARIIMENQHGQ